MRTAIGLLLGLAIGASCRFFALPVPSPPNVLGALLVVAMTVGYVGADRLLASRPRPAAALGAASAPDAPEKTAPGRPS
jgi:XapX domain-containing protein